MDCKQIGFIGAGKVGASLGKYFKEKGRKVGGYYSLSLESAQWAAAFTNTTCYKNIEEIVRSCHMIFLTVPDGAIASVWEEIKPFTDGKIICHCSGLHSSKIFSDIDKRNSYGYSIHPLMAVSNKEESYKEFSKALFTIEGDATYLSHIEEIFQNMGNSTRIISAENKIKYHAAAAILSNYMTGLFDISQRLFEECGFAPEEAGKELYSLAKGNLDHILEDGCVQALTGPIERNDITTVQKHMGVLEGTAKAVYSANARHLISIAEKKHPDRDYTALKALCRNDRQERHG